MNTAALRAHVFCGRGRDNGLALCEGGGEAIILFGPRGGRTKDRVHCRACAKLVRPVLGGHKVFCPACGRHMGSLEEGGGE